MFHDIQRLYLPFKYEYIYFTISLRSLGIQAAPGKFQSSKFHTTEYIALQTRPSSIRSFIERNFDACNHTNSLPNSGNTASAIGSFDIGKSFSNISNRNRRFHSFMVCYRESVTFLVGSIVIGDGRSGA